MTLFFSNGLNEGRFIVFYFFFTRLVIVHVYLPFAIFFFKSALNLLLGTRLAGTVIFFLVCKFIATRSFWISVFKVKEPLNLISSPATSALLISSNNLSIIPFISDLPQLTEGLILSINISFDTIFVLLLFLFIALF